MLCLQQQKGTGGNSKPELTINENEPEPEESVSVVTEKNVGLDGIDVRLQRLEREGKVGRRRRRHRVGGGVERNDAHVGDRRIDRRGFLVGAENDFKL